jgi:hypothetical protein
MNADAGREMKRQKSFKVVKVDGSLWISLSLTGCTIEMPKKSDSSLSKSSGKLPVWGKSRATPTFAPGVYHFYAVL